MALINQNLSRTPSCFNRSDSKCLLKSAPTHQFKGKLPLLIGVTLLKNEEAGVSKKKLKREYLVRIS